MNNICICPLQSKRKSVPVYAVKPNAGVELQLHSVLTSTEEVSFTRLTLYARGSIPLYSLNTKLKRPQRRSGCPADNKSPLPVPVPVCPCLYLLSSPKPSHCSNCTTPASHKYRLQNCRRHVSDVIIYTIGDRSSNTSTSIWGFLFIIIITISLATESIQHFNRGTFRISPLAIASYLHPLT